CDTRCIYPNNASLSSSSIAMPELLSQAQSPSLAPPPPASEPPSASTESPAEMSPTTGTFKRHKVNSAHWTLARLRDSPSRALPLLRLWSHPRRFREMTDTTVEEIKALSDDLAIKALNELKIGRAFVRGTRGTKLSLKTTVMALSTRSENAAEALLDSGCEGSCIDAKYVRVHDLPTYPLPRPI